MVLTAWTLIAFNAVLVLYLLAMLAGAVWIVADTLRGEL